jgi:hypothetical protein
MEGTCEVCRRSDQRSRRKLTADNLCPMGFIQTRSLSPTDRGKSHQGLAYGYKLSGSTVTPHVCDTNEDVSTRDQVTPSLNIGFTDRVIDLQRTSRGEHQLICSFHKNYIFRRPLWDTLSVRFFLERQGAELARGIRAHAPTLSS